MSSTEKSTPTLTNITLTVPLQSNQSSPLKRTFFVPSTATLSSRRADRSPTCTYSRPLGWTTGTAATDPWTGKKANRRINTNDSISRLSNTRMWLVRDWTTNWIAYGLRGSEIKFMKEQNAFRNTDDIMLLKYRVTLSHLITQINSRISSIN